MNPKVLSEEDTATVVAAVMMRYGDSFVEALGMTIMVANATGRRNIKETFPNEWNESAELAGVKP